MQFSQETNGLDLVSDVYYLSGSDSISYPIKDVTRNANLALDKILSLILRSDGKWQFDDTNLQSTELFDVSSNLVAETQKYAISVTWLKINRVRIKDSGGNWIILNPVDRRDLTDAQLTASSGTPSQYHLLGNYIYLDTTPSYSFSGGLEVQFQRGASYFAYTDTTKTPGFATQFHRLVSLYSARDYCVINSMDGRMNNIQGMINTMEAELVDFYSSRDADQKITLKTKSNDYGQI